MPRRELSEMLTGIAEALVSTRSAGVEVQARRIELELPVEVRFLASAGGAPVLAGDLPLWRWRTVFDQRPNRLSVTWIESHPS